jgi:hypothetical protein
MTTSPPDRPTAQLPRKDGAEGDRPPAREKLKIAINRIVASDEPIDADATQRLLAAIIAEFGPNLDEGHGWNPYADGDPNIFIGGKGANKVKLDDLLTSALAPVGYLRVEKLTYRARWSTDDVEQVLSFDTYGNPKEFLTGDAGLRNTKAEAFAAQCIQRYASPTYFRSLPKGGYVYPPFHCAMHFSMGSLFGWGVRGSLNTPDFSADELARAVVEPIQSTLIPCIAGVTTIERLHDFLESDREPLSWYVRGSSYRAALVAYLARKLGVTRDKTKASLLTHSRRIANGIDTTRLTPESYIDHILDDADAAVAQTAS